LPSLDNSEQGFRLRQLPGERRATRISPCDGGSLHTVHLDDAPGEPLLVRIAGHRGARQFQRNARGEAYPTKLTAIRIGMTIGGTNQLFIARLLRQDCLVRQGRPLLSTAFASNRAQSVSPRRFALGSNVRRYVRTRIERCPDESRAGPSPPGGTTRTRSRGCRICQARRRRPPRV